MKICSSSKLRLLLATAGLLAAASAQAASYAWAVEFDFVNGGGKGTGSFVSDGQSISEWDITTFRDWSQPIFEEPVFGYHYTSTSSTLDLSDLGQARLLRNGAPQDEGVGLGNWLSFSIFDGMARGGSFSGGALERTLSFGGSSVSQSGFVHLTSSLLIPTFDVLSAEETGPVSRRLSAPLSVSAPVPEPETMGMLALGLGLLGVAVHRRRNARPATAV